MFRPFVFIGLGAFAASFALFYSILAAVFCLGFTALITMVFIVSKKNCLNKGVVIALIFIILAVRLALTGITIENKSQALVGKTADIKAQIISIDYNSDSFASLSLKVTESANEEAKGIKLKATLMAHTDALPGDIISASVSFKQPDENYRAANFSNGYYYSADIEKIYSYKQKPVSVWRMVYNIRAAVSSAIKSAGNDEKGAVLNALIIGDKSGLSEELSECVRNSGVSHMLVVSGMHLSVLCGAMMGLLKRRSRRVTAIIIGSISALIMLTVCLFHVSVLRASIAYIVMLLAWLFRRNSDPLSALGFGVSLAVILAPYIFYNVAFLLSVSATFAVLYPSRLLIELADFSRFGRIGRLFKYVYDILIVSLCCIFCTLPIVVTCFGYVALAAILTNLLVSIAISCALIIGVLAVILFFLPLGRYISVPFFFLARGFVGFFVSVIYFIGKSGFGVVTVDEDKNIYCFFIAVAFILLVKLFSNFIKRRKEKNCAER